MLKKLELQGYKTFASRTEFLFESGITAIVGPNGSGKSNVADAIRWVLGEQSYRLLRGKKTEDMIFSGSQSRSRAGMAEATILLDNSDGQLPVEFSEVAISRRAYRSGENEYLLNGSKVRLRDINALLGASGLGQRTYNVIGQGLVDAALSLRAEERRKLFEEAAGISHYQEKRLETLTRLEATQRNLERVKDIVNEIRPRMRRLGRQAVRSRESNQVRKDLDNLLYLWYGYHWEIAKRSLRKARNEAADQKSTLNSVWAEQAALEKQIVSLRQEASHLRIQLGDMHHQNSKLHQEAEKYQRNLAVHTERLRLLGQQEEERETECGLLEQRRTQSADQFEQAQRELIRTDSLWQEQQAAVRRARSELDTGRHQAAGLRDQEQKAQHDLAQLESRVGKQQDRQSELVRRQAELSTERETTQNLVTVKSSEQTSAQSNLDAYQAKLDDIVERLAQLDERRAALRTHRRDAQTDLQRLTADLQESRARLTELEAQHRALTDLRARGVGHDAAVQEVMALPDRPTGIIGPVAQLLAVPAELEQAIAAILARELSTLVVASRKTVQQVISLTGKTERSGRLSLLPLDSLHPPQPITSPGDNSPTSSTVIGVAADLVSCESSYRPVVDLLLGQVLLVQDQETAHRLAPSLPSHSCVVTLQGLIIAQDGRVILPGQEMDKKLLAQERIWRSIPAKVDSASASLATAQRAATAGQEKIEQIDANFERLGALAGQLRQARQAVNQEREKAALQLDRLTQSIAWHRERLAEIDRQAEKHAKEIATLKQSQQELGEKRADRRSRHTQIKVQLAELPLDELASELSARERALAQTNGLRQNQQVIVTTHQTSLQELESQLSARKERIRAIATEREQLTSQTEQERRTERSLAEQIETVSHQIAPADAQLAKVEADLDERLADDQQLRRRVRSAEQIANRTQLTLDRAKNELEHLRVRIKDELGLVHLPLDEDIEGQTPLPLGEMVGHLPIVQELPSDLESSIQRRKQQLKRMGAINPNAPAEYAELEQRYTFLTEQTSDLQKADAKLRQVIAELDTVMEREFKRTFKEVASEFKKAFTRLFGGGSARLVLTDPEDPIQSGVEIIARPPDRRQQGLALLSGGERSLVAAALIFALLKVSPTPFCVLDEVDAMLDEANVGRFREMLAELSQETQFIVITHNRGTVQSADTIYGVSMRADGASQIISLRLEGEQLAMTLPN